MTPMPGAFDWLAVGDLGLEQTAGGVDRILGGTAGRLAAHGAALGARTALVAKVGDDEAGRRAQEMLRRLKVDVRWVQRTATARTTLFHDDTASPEAWRVDRGADAALRLDEVPTPTAAAARLVVVSGYSLSVEPARAAALGTLLSARSRHGRAALFLQADRLWRSNARMTRRVLEPAIAGAFTVALGLPDLAVLFGAGVEPRAALRQLAALGPRLIYLAGEGGDVWLQEGARVHLSRATGGREPRDRYAGPAAFWAELARGTPARKAVAAALRYAQGIRRPGAPR
jgi:sugar/nucleoside kinase (ribokinase family)